MFTNRNEPDTKWALHRLSLPLGSPGPQSALLMAWIHNLLLFLANAFDFLGILNIFHPSFWRLVQFTAQQLLVISAFAFGSAIWIPECCFLPPGCARLPDNVAEKPVRSRETDFRRRCHDNYFRLPISGCLVWRRSRKIEYPVNFFTHFKIKVKSRGKL